MIGSNLLKTAFKIKRKTLRATKKMKMIVFSPVVQMRFTYSGDKIVAID